MKLVISYQSSDQYTYFIDTYKFIEADSIEEVQLAFLEKLEAAVVKQHSFFNFLDIDFYLPDYYQVTNSHLGKKGQIEHFRDLDVIPIDKIHFNKFTRN